LSGHWVDLFSGLHLISWEEGAKGLEGKRKQTYQHIEAANSAVETTYRGNKSVLHISILEAHIEAANSAVEIAYRGSKSVLHISILEAHIEAANSAVRDSISVL
jgi:DNA-binding protein YbaB